MPSAPVCDASPLIYLARANRLWIARALSPTVFVPRAVADEIEAKGEGDLAAQALTTTGWLEIVDSPVPQQILEWGLGRGEAAVLAWAQANSGTLAILDDREARTAARSLRVPVIGTLGIVLKAKSAGLIAAARPELELLAEQGMYLSSEVIDRALELVGE